MRPYRGKFYLSILLMLLAVPLAQFALFLTRDVTNQALTATTLSADERWSTVVRIVTLQAIFFMSSAILSTWREVTEWYGSMRSTFDLRLAFYKHLHRLPMSFLNKRLPGEHLFRATQDMVSVFRIAGRPASATPSGQAPPDSKEVAMAIYSNDVDPYDPGVMGLIVRTIPLMAETLYGLGWGVALLYLIDPYLSLGLLLYIFPFAFISHRLFDKIRHTAFEYKAASERETGVLRDSIAGLRTLKALGRLKYQRLRYTESVVNARRRSIQQISQMVLVQNGAQMGMKWVFSLGMYVYLTSRVMQGSATLGDWIAAFLLIEAAQGPLENFVQLIQLVKVQLVPAQRILETLDVKPAIDDAPDARPLPELAGRIEFQGVTFSYEPTRPVLRDLDLVIEPGSFVGIVGPSGAGKSSLISLLLRIYVPESGTISIDSVDLQKLKLDTFLDQVGTVPQTTCLYGGSIEDNILFGNPWASEGQVLAAANLSGVTAFAGRLPDGLNTELLDGATISGGERQRIGIARALVRNPRLLVLDEATANLDPETEEAILQTINRLRTDLTIVSVAHRLKAVVTCDRILVMDKGRIVQSGTHAELVAQPGLYASLWAQQNTMEASA